MVKKKCKNTKLRTGRLFWSGGGTGLASNYSALGNQYRAQGLFPEGTNNVNNWKPEYKSTGNSIDGGEGGSGGSAMGKVSQIGGLIGMFDSLAASASNAIDSGRAGTAGKSQVLVEGVLGGQSGNHLANMWSTGAKTADAINYVNNAGNVEFASNNSDNLIAAHSGVNTLDSLNIDTTGKEWQDFIFDPLSYVTTRWILGTRETAEQRQAKINAAINAANARQEASYANAVNDFAKQQARNVAANYRAFGGPMYGYMSDGAIAYDMARDNLMVKMLNAQNKNQAQPPLSFAAGGLLSDNFTNGVTTIGAGGSHESNPYSGVPMGVAEDGQPNLVEEGEAVYNDYVYSNRLKVPEAVRSKYKLRGPKNMTYAEAFLAAQKESEERENDPISKRGLDNIAGVLAQSQEEVRAKKESRKKARGGHLYFSGSLLDEPPFDVGSMTPQEFYRINNYWPDGYDPTTGEWATLGDSNWTPEKLASVTGESLSDIAPSVAPGSATKPVTVSTGTNAPLKTVASGDNGSYLSNDINLLRLAPIAGNVGAVFMDALGVTNKPAYYNYIPNYAGIGFSPLGEYVPEFHTDTRYAANQQAQQAAATRNAIMNTTAPNRLASLLAADYNAQNTYGNLLRDAEVTNYDNLLKARTFNRATDEFNSEMGLKAAAQDAQERLAYAQAKLAQAKANTDETNASWGARAQNIKGLTTSLGNLGKELDSRDMIKWLTVKGVLGNYSEKDLRGMGVDESVIKEVKGDKYVGTKKAHGGKLRKKRGGFTC